MPLITPEGIPQQVEVPILALRIEALKGATALAGPDANVEHVMEDADTLLVWLMDDARTQRVLNESFGGPG